MEKNIAFIDGQNLHLGTREEGWTVDLEKFRIHLKDKYNVSKAYYFMGYVKDENNSLYTKLQESGFIIIFKKQMVEMNSKKKGNIDSDMIFHVMWQIIEKSDSFDKIVMVTGDGDFKILIDYLIEKDRFKKILFPNKKYASSLYNDLFNHNFSYLINVRNKIKKFT